MTHSPDCDGYTFDHIGHVRHEGDGRGMWQAECDSCDWRGTLYGPDARNVASREAFAHTREIACDGRCAR